MLGQHPGPRTASDRRRPALYAAIVAFTVILSSAAVVFGFRLSSEPQRPARTLDVVTLAARRSTRVTPSSVTTTPAAVDTTRLAVSVARRLLDTPPGAALPARTDVDLALPALPSGARAVLLEVSMLNATGPGTVTVHSDADDVPALRLLDAHAYSSATVVVLIGSDPSLTVRTEGGGELQVNLVGVFETARTATAGRIVAVPATRVLRLRPPVDGHDADLTLADLPGHPGAGAVSAVLLQVSGDVGAHGGHVFLGPSADRLNQKVYWSATSGADRFRPGFVVVPVAKNGFHLRYHAGKELRVDVVGYVTGARTPAGTDGLAVPLPYRAAGAVRVATAGRTNVTVVPPAGLAGVAPARVTATLLGLSATSGTPGGVTVAAPGHKTGGPILSVAAKPRSALTLTAITNGSVSVAGQAGAAVILTPRVLVLRR